MEASKLKGCEKIKVTSESRFVGFANTFMCALLGMGGSIIRVRVPPLKGFGLKYA